MQSVGHLTHKSGVLGSIPGLATYFHFSFRWFERGSCQLLAKICARSTGYRLGGLSLPRKSVVRSTDRPDMTLDVYRGRKTTIQPTNQLEESPSEVVPVKSFSTVLGKIRQNILNPVLPETHKRVIGKQCRPKSDATYCGIWSGSTVFAYRIFIKNRIKVTK